MARLRATLTHKSDQLTRKLAHKSHKPAQPRHTATSKPMSPPNRPSALGRNHAPKHTLEQSPSPHCWLFARARWGRARTRPCPWSGGRTRPAGVARSPLRALAGRRASTLDTTTTTRMRSAMEGIAHAQGQGGPPRLGQQGWENVWGAHRPKRPAARLRQMLRKARLLPPSKLQHVAIESSLSTSGSPSAIPVHPPNAGPPPNPRMPVHPPTPRNRDRSPTAS